MRHDLLCSIGADLFTLSLPSDVEPMPHGLDVIHIDVDPWEIGKNYAAAVGIQGDPKATLPELCEAVRRHTSKNGHPAGGQAPRGRRRGRQRGRARRAERRRAVGQPGADGAAHARARGRPGHAARRDHRRRDDLVGAGVRTFFQCEDAKSFFGLRGGGIGWGLPAAIGVKLALPQRPVVALIGDGSAMYTCQGLWTAAHDSVPVVFVIFNNASYRILKQRTQALKGFSAEDDVYVGMDLDRPLIDHVGPRQVVRRPRRADREGVRGRPGDGPRARQRRSVPDRRAHRPVVRVSRIGSPRGRSARTGRRLPEPRGHELGEALHRGQHALVGDERADIHRVRRKVLVKLMAVQLLEPVDDALGGAVDGEIEHLLELMRRSRSPAARRGPTSSASPTER